jgi:hypothetical protein
VPSLAVEGSSTAGPIGGTDIRSAQLPPPGVYGGTIEVYAAANHFYDGGGAPVAALDALRLERFRVGPFLLYVPDVQVLGGAVGIGVIVPAGPECGRLFATTARRCISGVGDPYAETDWSRFFGALRPSKYPGALPIAEGLTVLIGFGTVIPIGKYNVVDATTQGLTIGNNLWDIAPTAAFTYVTKPILAEGTEFSAKLYVNNYLQNPASRYYTGRAIDIDFAASEHVGKFQAGLAGYYVFQTEDDKLNGIPIAPDGRKAEQLTLGPVLAYDIPEYNAFVKLKALTTVITHNTVGSRGVILEWAKKF